MPSPLANLAERNSVVATYSHVKDKPSQCRVPEYLKYEVFEKKVIRAIVN